LAAGHADPHELLRESCIGVPLAGERKSIQPMVARLHSERVQPAWQSMHQLVAQPPWSDEAALREARCLGRGSVVARIVDEPGIPKMGRRSVGAARQYCGPLGKEENCQVTVSLSVATREASLPVAGSGC
jgi:SRSO17 transposase